MPCVPDSTLELGLSCDPNSPFGRPLILDPAEIEYTCFEMLTYDTLFMEEWPEPLCEQGGAHNVNWFPFMANDTAFSLTVEVCKCDTVGPIGMALTGIQAGIYENCDYENSVWCMPFCLAANNTLDIMVGGLAIGEVYHLFFDGCGGSVCTLYFGETSGMGGVVLLDQETINGFEENETLFICEGYENFNLFTHQSNMAAAEYEWVLPDESIIQTGTDTFINYTFEDAGSFEVCVTSFFVDFDTSEQICIDIEVITLPALYDTFQTCEGDSYYIEEYDIELTEAGENFFMLEQMNGCDFEAFLYLDVIEENDEQPTQLSEVLCSSELLPYILQDSSFVEECGNYEIVIQSVSGCDSFIDFELEIIETYVEFASEDCYSDVYTVQFFVNAEACGEVVQSISWLDPNGNEIPDAESFQLQIPASSDSGDYSIVVETESQGVLCANDTNSIQFIPENFLTTIANIDAPDTVCLQDVAAVSAEVFNSEFLQSQITEGGIIVQFEDNYVLVHFTELGEVEVCLNSLNLCNTSDTLCTTIFVTDTFSVLVSEDSFTLAASLDSASYQWIDCGNNNASIEGATEQVFEPESSSSYAVIVTKNGCSITSDCYDFNIVNSNELFRSDWNLYYSSIRRSINIAAEEPLTGSLEIYSISGQLLGLYDLNNEREFSALLSLNSGAFLAVFRDDLGGLKSQLFIVTE